jgi:hypothetical protein
LRTPNEPIGAKQDGTADERRRLARHGNTDLRFVRLLQTLVSQAGQKMNLNSVETFAET